MTLRYDRKHDRADVGQAYLMILQVTSRWSIPECQQTLEVTAQLLGGITKAGSADRGSSAGEDGDSDWRPRAATIGGGA
jgi:hypothetical protein